MNGSDMRKVESSSIVTLIMQCLYKKVNSFIFLRKVIKTAK